MSSLAYAAITRFRDGAKPDTSTTDKAAGFRIWSIRLRRLARSRALSAYPTILIGATSLVPLHDLVGSLLKTAKNKSEKRKEHHNNAPSKENV